MIQTERDAVSVPCTGVITAAGGSVRSTNEIGDVAALKAFHAAHASRLIDVVGSMRPFAGLRTNACCLVLRFHACVVRILCCFCPRLCPCQLPSLAPLPALATLPS